MYKTKGLFLVVGLLLLLSVEGVRAQAYPPQSKRPVVTPKIVQPTVVKPMGIKLVACEAVEAAVTVRMESLVKLAVTMREKFGAITSRVENYYADELVTAGKVVDNYDELVSQIASESALVDINLKAAAADVEEFGCDADDPRDLLNTFREDMQAVKQQLANYRTAIKNLIVAVHTVSL